MFSLNKINKKEEGEYIEIASQKIKIDDINVILLSQYAFITGIISKDGHPIITFPDNKAGITYEQYYLLISYIFQAKPQELDNQLGYIIVIDRRTDKWSSVRQIFSYLMEYFPESVHVIFLLKPEGVFQRAVEVGYRNFIENNKFKIITFQDSNELLNYIGPEYLTMDVGGQLKYNYSEWVQHRMDIERMKNSASIIAESLTEFGKLLRETEIPNDVETTEQILEAQKMERDAIKEDFRLSIRKGLSLLRQVRKLEQKQASGQFNHICLNNVTAIEHMLLQLEDTERSFDAFWEKHRQRLTNCLQLRRFEESFRKFQACFAKHMLYLEEHREIGDSLDKAILLSIEHEDYVLKVKNDVQMAITLQQNGEELIASQNIEHNDSLRPKCDELARMIDALSSALEYRTRVIDLSKIMHQQINEANKWCKRGVELLSTIPLKFTSNSIKTFMNSLDIFLLDGESLQLNFLKDSSNMDNLILLTTIDSSNLLSQVAERVDDIRRMSVSRRDVLYKMAERESRKPIQIVIPEKIANKNTTSISAAQTESNEEIKNVKKCLDANNQLSVYNESNKTINSKIRYVIEELINTEKTYVLELKSIIECYIKPFESSDNINLIPVQLRGQTETIFGNIRELLEFHNHSILDEFLKYPDLPTEICHILINQRNNFLQLYRYYCQNKPHSEAMRREYVDGNKFFLECQQRAGHLLPLSSYLLKPIQRITKYQLLLKELLRHCNEDMRQEVQAALAAMLDLLTQLNSDMHQLHILGFIGDLRLLGPLRLQTECDVFPFKRKSHKLANKIQKRYLFLFDGGILFCKKRNQQISVAPEYYEYKLCIPIQNLGFAECPKTSSNRFEIWDVTKTDGYEILTLDENIRFKWIQKIKRLNFIATSSNINADGKKGDTTVPVPRPQSWTSECTISSRTSVSTSDENCLMHNSECICNIANDSNGKHSCSASNSQGFSNVIENHTEIDKNPILSTFIVTTINTPSSRSLPDTSNEMKLLKNDNASKTNEEDQIINKLFNDVSLC